MSEPKITVDFARWCADGSSALALAVASNKKRKPLDPFEARRLCLEQLLSMSKQAEEPVP